MKKVLGRVAELAAMYSKGSSSSGEKASFPSPKVRKLGDRSKEVVFLTPDQKEAVSKLKSKKEALAAKFLQEFLTMDACFLFDFTGSMQPCIDQARKVAQDSFREIKQKFGFNEFRAALVGYRDYSDKEQFVVHGFTEDWKKFISNCNVKATGGGDIPEDVLGGLEKAVALSWKCRLRVLIHITDAPGHGESFNNGHSDSYPQHGSVKRAEEVLQKLANKDITYILVTLNSSCDQMFKKFQEICPPSHRERLMKLSLEEIESFKAVLIRSATIATVHAFSHSQINISEDGEMAEAKNRDIAFITSAPSGVKDPRLVSKERWSELCFMWSKQSADITEEIKLIVEQLELAAVPEAKKGSLYFSKPATCRIDTKPFAAGASRLAYYGYLNDEAKLVVLKREDGKRSKALQQVTAQRTLETQFLASLVVKAFNEKVPKKNQLSFVDVRVLRDDIGHVWAAENYLGDGKFVKYNSNIGYVGEDGDKNIREAAQAFSHYSFEVSGKRLLFCDLQGVGSTLTDIAMHSTIPTSTPLPTDLASAGFEQFFRTHTCNEVCKLFKFPAVSLSKLQ